MMINDIKIHQTSHLTDESFLQAEGQHQHLLNSESSGH